ncbi:shikimate kinase [Paradesulfitobacterium ferrireducens]|uniref:shikimate kinase n=1 Tax=Paradesulfitobacterium ferrireducens TaxID=2816476 RepID=UPI001A8F890A|nr:shikimate kinase [Paradesulfitobacterium ferrireducens]
MKKVRNIILTGFMGSGKSTVGKRLARTLGWEFIDTDLEIERITDMTVAEIFKRHGETRFRSEESLMVKRLMDRENCVIATGGGTVLNPENQTLLAQMGVVISLYAPVETILERVGHRTDRPLLKTGREEIEALWEARQAAYARADYIVDTTEKNIEEVEKEILVYLEEEDKLGKSAKD